MSLDSTDPKPEAEPPLAADLPGWLTPAPKLDQLDPDRTTVTDLPPAMTQTPQFDPDAPELDDEVESRDPTNPSPEEPSRRSAGRRIVDPSVAAAASLFALVALLASTIVNKTVGHGSGAYLMHQTEAEAIATPLGRIAARRAPIGDGEATDIADGIQAGTATAAYAARATMEHFGNQQEAPQ